jgi:hypothetical protein
MASGIPATSKLTRTRFARRSRLLAAQSAAHSAATTDAASSLQFPHREFCERNLPRGAISCAFSAWTTIAGTICRTGRGLHFPFGLRHFRIRALSAAGTPFLMIARWFPWHCLRSRRTRTS